MKQHRYRVTLEYLADAEGNPQQRAPLVFEAGSHDEIFQVVERVRQSALMDADTTTTFVVGQKLFGEVILENRNSPLFTEFWPHLLAFMKKFKGLVTQGTGGAKDA